MVKRMVLEWGLIRCLGTWLALLTSWVVSRFFDRSLNLKSDRLASVWRLGP